MDCGHRARQGYITVGTSPTRATSSPRSHGHQPHRGGKWENRRDSRSGKTDRKAGVADNDSAVLGKTKKYNHTSIHPTRRNAKSKCPNMCSRSERRMSLTKSKSGEVFVADWKKTVLVKTYAKTLRLQLNIQNAQPQQHACNQGGRLQTQNVDGSCIDSVRGGCWVRQRADLPSEASFGNASKPWSPLSCGARTRRGRRKTSGQILSVNSGSHPRQA